MQSSTESKHAAEESFPWPQECRGAVSLTFDDAMQSQLDVALPILEQFGLRATFYVNPTPNFLEQRTQWATAQAKGHELGNHTVSHPCSENFAFISQNGRRSLESFSIADIEDEILEAQRLLDAAIPGQGPVSFAYPCYQPFVGKGAARQSYVPVVARHCVAGRGRGETSNDPFLCDTAYLWSFPCERMTGAQMVGLVEDAIDLGRWTILTFHGIHEGHLAVSDRDFETLCRHLAAQATRVWVPTVAEGARLVQQVQQAQAAKSV